MSKWLAAAGFITLALLSGCQPAQIDRQGRLLSMAGEEAAGISNKLDRFGRQLNIADIQLRSGRAADADKMLLLARDTLTAASKSELDDFHRIAGWTAIAQLALRANDHDLALKSADASMAALNDVQPVAQRAEYVLSLSWVFAEVRDKSAAIELINSGGAWAGEITDLGTRRRALMAFASQLLAYDAFENARTLLRHDADPAWRTDAMLTLAQPNTQIYTALAASSAGRGFGGGGGGGRGASSPMMPEDKRNEQAQPASYGKDVRFESVYQRAGN